MPEVFRKFGFSFFFFSREHEPIHIHVEGNDGYAKFNWNSIEFCMEFSEGIKVNDLKKIKDEIQKHKDDIIKKWNEHFGYE